MSPSWRLIPAFLLSVLATDVATDTIVRDPVTDILLPALTATETSRLRKLEATGPLRFGIGRDLLEDRATLDTTQKEFSLRLRSSGAAGIRLALRVSHLPDDAIYASPVPATKHGQYRAPPSTLTVGKRLVSTRFR
jgi:hypothetical protein